jgi:hypothetical protein
LDTAVSLQNPALTPNILITSATSPLGQRASAWLAQTGIPLTLFATEPDRLIMLKQELEAGGAKSRISLATTPEPALRHASLIVLPEPQPLLDWQRCAPGAVVVDLVRPFAHPPQTWQSRLDMLVLQTTAVRLPGQPVLGYDFAEFGGDIPPELAELILLSLEGQPPSLGLEAVPSFANMRLVADLFARHQFQLAAGRSYHENITPAKLAERAELAQQRTLFSASHSPEAENALQLKIDSAPASSRLTPTRKRWLTITGLGTAVAALIAGIFWWQRRNNEQ